MTCYAFGNALTLPLWIRLRIMAHCIPVQGFAELPLNPTGHAICFHSFSLPFETCVSLKMIDWGIRNMALTCIGYLYDIPTRSNGQINPQWRAYFSKQGTNQQQKICCARDTVTKLAVEIVWDISALDSNDTTDRQHIWCILRKRPWLSG